MPRRKDEKWKRTVETTVILRGAGYGPKVIHNALVVLAQRGLNAAIPSVNTLNDWCYKGLSDIRSKLIQAVYYRRLHSIALALKRERNWGQED